MHNYHQMYLVLIYGNCTTVAPCTNKILVFVPTST